MSDAHDAEALIPPSREDIEEAHEAFQNSPDVNSTGIADAATRRPPPDIRWTPLIRSEPLSRIFGCNIFLKLENLQRTGSYKIRGAYNRIRKTDPGTRIVTASAGNHAQGVAYATAFLERKQAVIMMPKDAPWQKRKKTAQYDNSPLGTPDEQKRIWVRATAESYDDAKKIAKEIEEKEGYLNVPAFDHPDVIAGQGTIGLEILEDCPEVNVIIAPVGGGGLLSGITIAVQSLKSDVRIYGVEAEFAAPFVHSFRRGEAVALGEARTIADGISVSAPGKLTWKILSERLKAHNFIDVDDPSIASALATLHQTEGIVAEGAGATGIAALLKSRRLQQLRQLPLIPDLTPSTNVVVVISGGNIDLDKFASYVDIAGRRDHRLVEFQINAPRKNGEWVQLLQIIDTHGATLIAAEQPSRVVYRNDGNPSDRLNIVIELLDENSDEIMTALRAAGFSSELMHVPDMMPAANSHKTKEFRSLVPKRTGALAKHIRELNPEDRMRLQIHPLVWHPGSIVNGVYSQWFHFVAEDES